MKTQLLSTHHNANGKLCEASQQNNRGPVWKHKKKNVSTHFIQVSKSLKLIDQMLLAIS